MPRRLASLLLAALSPALALAAEAAVDIGKLEGVYRRSFRNGDISGAKFTSTDVLEILAVDKGGPISAPSSTSSTATSARFPASPTPTRGRSSIATTAAGLTIRCVLRLVPGGGRIQFEDVGGLCAKESCGARGWYNQSSFKAAARRRIADPARLKASTEYKEAVEADEARRQKAKPRGAASSSALALAALAPALALAGDGSGRPRQARGRSIGSACRTAIRPARSTRPNRRAEARAARRG